MMRFILAGKHWQIFLIITCGLIFSNIDVKENPTTTMFLKIMGFLTYFLWPMFVGYGLQDYSPGKVKISPVFFLFNGCLFLLVYLSVIIISDGEGMKFSGLAALPFFYVFYAGLQYLSFPAKMLRSIENRKPASLGDYFGDFILVLFLPIGIWFLQPRINKVVEEYESLEAKPESIVE